MIFFLSAGKLEIFYRNCAQNGTVADGSCRTELTKALDKEICTCRSNYCNDAQSTSQAGHSLAAIAAALLAIFSAARSSTGV